MHGDGIADVFRSVAAASLPKVTIGLLLAFGGCAQPTNVASSNTGSAGQYQVFIGPGKDAYTFGQDQAACRNTTTTTPMWAQCMLNSGNAIVDPQKRYYDPVTKIPRPYVASAQPLPPGQVATIPPPSTASVSGSVAPASVREMWTNYRAAMAAEMAHNGDAAAPYWRQAAAAAEVGVAFADMSPGSYFLLEAGQIPRVTAEEYAQVLATARAHIGMDYEFGVGVPQDFDEALNWYHKAVNTTTLAGALVPMNSGATQGIGLLYAYGLGVPRDRNMARQLLVKARADNLVTLLDNNALPSTIRGNSQFFRDVAEATNELQQRQAEGLASAFRAGAQNAGQARTAPAQGGQEPGWLKCDVLPSPMGYANVPTLGAVAGCSPW